MFGHEIDAGRGGSECRGAECRRGQWQSRVYPDLACLGNIYTKKDLPGPAVKEVIAWGRPTVGVMRVLQQRTVAGVAGAPAAPRITC